MVGLVWLLAAVGVLGTDYGLSTWQTFLLSVDGSLPLLSPVNSKICYHFDVSQTCSGEAIGQLLGLFTVADPSSWTATSAQCDTLLDGQRLYAEGVASRVFDAAILSAATAGVTDFELMVQSWVLRVGHFPLIHTHTAFVDALKGISDWKTVKCDGANLLYDTTTITKPDFLTTKDCDVLGTVYPVPLPPDCNNASCSLSDAGVCCVASYSGTCCQVNYSTITATCGTAGCPYHDVCCGVSLSTNACCPVK